MALSFPRSGGSAQSRSRTPVSADDPGHCGVFRGWLIGGAVMVPRPSATARWGDRVAQSARGGKHSVIARQVHSRHRHGRRLRTGLERGELGRRHEST